MNANRTPNRITLFQTGLAGGGAERVMLHLAEGLAECGYGVDLVVCHGDGPLRYEIPESVRLVDLGAFRIIASLPALVRYVRRERPEVMLSALAPANCLAVWARALSRIQYRLILAEHNHLSVAIKGAVALRARLLPALMRRTYGHADGIVAVSGGVADDLAQSIGLRRERIDVIYNPVVTPRLEALSHETVEHSWLQPGQPPVFLGIGRLTPQKDFPTLIRAFARVREIREARLMILGDGEERGDLERVITDLGLEQDVALPGFVPNPYAYMRAAAMFVLSSRWEGLPTVLIEALACGTPVVSTDCPSGPAEILEDGRWGRLVRVGDVSTLSDAMLRRLEDDSPAPDGLQGRARAFTGEVATENYLKTILGRL